MKFLYFLDITLVASLKLDNVGWCDKSAKLD